MRGEDYEGAGDGEEESVDKPDDICREGEDVDESEYNDYEEYWEGR